MQVNNNASKSNSKLIGRLVNEGQPQKTSLALQLIKNEEDEQLGSINSKHVASTSNTVNWQCDYISELN